MHIHRGRHWRKKRNHEARRYARRLRRLAEYLEQFYRVALAVRKEQK